MINRFATSLALLWQISSGWRWRFGEFSIKFHKLLPACSSLTPAHRSCVEIGSFKRPSPIDVNLIDIFPTLSTPQEVVHRLLHEINQENQRRAIAMRRKECLGVKETIEELAPVAGSSSLCAMTINFLFFFLFSIVFVFLLSTGDVIDWLFLS